MSQIAGFRGTLPDAGGARTRDPVRALYRYHQVFELGGRQVTRKQIVCVVRLLPWAERLIRPHEATDPAERAALLAQIEKTKIQDAPILAGFRDAAGEVERLFRGVDSGRADYEHTTPDGCLHRVFRTPSAEILGPLHRAFAPKKLHVLDGTSRYEAMLAYSDALDAKTSLAMYSSAKYGMMCLANLDDVTLYSTTVARHRIVRGKLDAAAILAGAKAKFIIEKLAGIARDPAKLRAALADSVAHQPAFTISFKDNPDAYKLTLSPEVAPAREGVPVHRAMQKMDPVVFELVFRPMALATAQVTQTLDLDKALKATDADAVIAMRALQLSDAIHVDELNELLPAGSMAFAPAIAPNVTFAIEPDEDVQ